MYIKGDNVGNPLLLAQCFKLNFYLLLESTLETPNNRVSVKWDASTANLKGVFL